MENNHIKTKKQIQYGDYDSLVRINELNKNELITMYSQLKRVENTKAWKMMCALRRLNEQFLKAPKSEKRKFLRWTKNKILKKPINKELELAQFSPLKSSNFEIHDFEIIQNTDIQHTDTVTPVPLTYKKYDTPINYDVFRFPVIEWDFRWQRPQQIASQFADYGHRVFYFSIDTEGANDNSTFEEVVNNVQIKELRKNVWWVKLCASKSLNAYRDTINEKDLLFLKWSLDYLKGKFSISHTISIVDLPFWTSLVLEIEKNITLYDCMDDHAGFSTNSDSMLLQEKRLFEDSDIVVATSQRLYEKVNKFNDNCLLVRNAGEYDYFSRMPKTISKDIPVGKGPIIGYYGAISEWFDIKLIEELAKRNKNWTFVLVGDTFGCSIEAASKLSNVIFTGEKPYTELTSYLYGFDVCLIPFLVNELTLATNPVKVYEYLAAGKPVVSTELPELKVMSHLVSLATTVEDFEEAIKANLQDSENKKIERMKFAENNSWSARYKQLSSEIAARFYPKISIIIVTYNNWSFTKQCLDSLFANSDYPNLEIIVVDNASQDETRIELSKIIHPQLKVILSPINEGFAGGNNRGIKESTGDYIILLNNDTIVPHGWVERLINPLKANKLLGMVGPMSNSVGNDQMLDFFKGDGFEGPHLDWLDEFYSMYKGKIHLTELLGFYCVAIKREVYDKIGGLDINYGLGMFEDDDYCERVKREGYKLAIVEDAFVYHHGSVSFKKLEDEKYRSIFMKNKAYFERKWNKAWELPNNPRTLFYNLLDSNSVAEVINNIDMKKVLIVGQHNWSDQDDRYKKISKSLSEQNVLVITHTHTYHNEDLVGIRKLGPNIYLSNRLDLLDKISFDVILCCGKDEEIPTISAKHKIVDLISIPDYDSNNLEIIKMNIPDVLDLKEEITTLLTTVDKNNRCE